VTLPTLAGVLGFPVAHSRSPAMMGAAFEALGLNWRYVRLPVPPERFEETARALAGSGYRGANVTTPHKVAALAVADGASDAAAAIGAANTLTFVDDGAIEADNTDAPGILDALGEDVRGAHALVLGAGGAARAAVWALREGGAAEISIWNRTAERAAGIAAQLGARFSERPGPANLVVNATSVGLEPAPGEKETLEALGLAGLDPPAVLVDLPYGTGETPLCAWASRAGARVIDGVEVLVRQGARSLERWTGRSAPLEAMSRAARDPATG
jgi:shikimate dehydrogenase